jgi:hypothetical protein
MARPSALQKAASFGFQSSTATEEAKGASLLCRVVFSRSQNAPRISIMVFVQRQVASIPQTRFTARDLNHWFLLSSKIWVFVNGVF